MAAEYLSLVNPRRRRSHSRRHHRRRNPDGTFAGLMPNPRRRHHRRRRNPFSPHDDRFLAMPGRHHRRRRNPGGGLFEGVDAVDAVVATAGFWGVDWLSKEFSTLTNQTSPNAYLQVLVKAIASVAVGIVGEVAIGRGPSAVIGGLINTTMSLADTVAPSIGQPAPFPMLGGGTTSTGTTAGGLAQLASGTSTTSQVQATNSGVSYSASVGGL